MNLLIIPSWYTVNSNLNAGIFFKEQAQIIAKAGNINVTVLFLNYVYRNQKKEQDYYKLVEKKDGNTTLFRVDIPSLGLSRIPNLFYKYHKIIGLHAFKIISQDISFDLVHAHSFLKGGALALNIKEMYNIPFIITEHTSKILYNDLNAYEINILKKCCEQSDDFICVSKNLRSSIVKILGHDFKSEIIPNLVNPIFKYLPKNNDFLFTSVGNLVLGKKMDILIKGFCEAAQIEENLKLEIIGEGVQRTNLEGLINSIDSKNISLIGSLPRSEVVKHLQKSKCMALISEKETFGVAYIEALATGNVVIAYKNGGSDDIVTEENGVFIDTLDPQKVKEAVLYIYYNYNKYNTKKISEDCLTQYGEDSFVNRMLHVIDRYM